MYQYLPFFQENKGTNAWHSAQFLLKTDAKMTLFFVVYFLTKCFSGLELPWYNVISCHKFKGRYKVIRLFLYGFNEVAYPFSI